MQSLDSDLSDGPITTQEYLQVKNALVASEAKIQQLLKVNVHLSDELRITQKKVPRGRKSGRGRATSCLPLDILSSWREEEDKKGQYSQLRKQKHSWAPLEVLLGL